MEVMLVRALAAAARAFADEIERGLPPDALDASAPPTPGSPRSMFEVLRSVSLINEQQSRGATDDEIRLIARRAGLDPRGMAGYYAANLLEMRDDGTRWVSLAGRERQHVLSRVVLLDAHGAPPQEPPQPRKPGASTR
jgi:hypothetical protein